MASFHFYPEIPNVPGSCWTWPVFLCIYLIFFLPFLLAGPEQGFSLCQLDPSSPSTCFSCSPLGGQSHSSLVAPSVSLCPAGHAPAILLAVVPPVPPPPHPSPAVGPGSALDLLMDMAGRLCWCSCAGTAWHGQADEPQQLLAGGPGSCREPPPLYRVSGLHLTLSPTMSQQENDSAFP